MTNERNHVKNDTKMLQRSFYIIFNALKYNDIDYNGIIL